MSRNLRWFTSRLIPTVLDDDRICLVPCGDCGDAMGLGSELSPRLAAGLDDGLVGFVDAIGEIVAAQICPDIFDWIEFGRIGRQRQQAEVGWKFQALPGMPTGTIEDDHTMGAGGATALAMMPGWTFMASMLAVGMTAPAAAARAGQTAPNRQAQS